MHKRWKHTQQSFDIISHLEMNIEKQEKIPRKIFDDIIFWLGYSLYNLYECAKEESSAYISLSSAKPSFQFP